MTGAGEPRVTPGTEGASLPANLSGPRTAHVRPLWKATSPARRKMPADGESAASVCIGCRAKLSGHRQRGSSRASYGVPRPTTGRTHVTPRSTRIAAGSTRAETLAALRSTCRPRCCVHRLRWLADARALRIRPRRTPRGARRRGPVRHLAHGRVPGDGRAQRRVLGLRPLGRSLGYAGRQGEVLARVVRGRRHRR